MSVKGKADEDRSRRRREGFTLLSVLGLLVTLLFQTLGVWQGARDTKAGRVTQQVGLLTTLNANATESGSKIIIGEALDRAAEPLPDRRELDRASEASVYAGLAYYNYLSWLYNEEHLSIARSFFAPRMIDGWNLARCFYTREVLAEDFEMLAQFVNETQDKAPPNSRCEEEQR